jgi:hypothetical protein
MTRGLLEISLEVKLNPVNPLPMPFIANFTKNLGVLL